ncbi:hypothetical protein EV144_1011383 [Flavobacterium sp. 270]|uniref:hypothetical protein n=1 Tax=Flavobacterium sp. 270 TaxID=2512114 RepID=UPI0010651FE5|nr:hypothetical protein [Flavobacterium sp. 270]TDW52692.1 hypothetical protein EV144_1011383 [Flavobacterium sp. 270]
MSKISVNYEKSFDKLIEKLQLLLKNEDGHLTCINNMGNFNVNSPIGVFKGTYVYKNNIISINLDKKPFFISTRLIENEVKKYLLEN